MKNEERKEERKKPSWPIFLPSFSFLSFLSSSTSKGTPFSTLNTLFFLKKIPKKIEHLFPFLSLKDTKENVVGAVDFPLHKPGQHDPWTGWGSLSGGNGTPRGLVARVVERRTYWSNTCCKLFKILFWFFFSFLFFFFFFFFLLLLTFSVFFLSQGSFACCDSVPSVLVWGWPHVVGKVWRANSRSAQGHAAPKPAWRTRQDCAPEDSPCGLCPLEWNQWYDSLIQALTATAVGFGLFFFDTSQSFTMWIRCLARASAFHVPVLQLTPRPSSRVFFGNLWLSARDFWWHPRPLYQCREGCLSKVPPWSQRKGSSLFPVLLLCSKGSPK